MNDTQPAEPCTDPRHTGPIHDQFGCTCHAPAVSRPTGLDALLDYVVANLPDEDDAPTGQKFPCGLGVFCDTCGATFKGDFIVSDTMTKVERLAVIRDHVRTELGWQCDDAGDFCPKCRPNVPTAEQPVDGEHQDNELRAELAKLIRWHKEDGEQLTKMRSAIEQLRAERDELIRQRDRIANDTTKAIAEQPTGPTDRPASEINREQRDNIDFNRGGVVAALRDALLDPAEHTPTNATVAARLLLAAHTRQLAAAAREYTTQRNTEMRKAGDRRRSATVTGMRHIVRMLDARAALVDPQPEVPAAEQPAFALPALAVPCPRCESARGQLCTSHNGTRDRHHDVHQARTAAYQEHAGR
ncbi:hypothetical protein [Streptomyces sp. NPDC056061]|uniref:zinc finger domain-containing protein n=1 Tax=Streptomyces sp. NPDC056061 TaxID=3345700 RepID=UPI0035E08548